MEAAVREALRAGRQPKEILRRDGLTRRAALPDIVLLAPSGEELLLMNRGRVTPTGREWDRQRAAQARSRSPRGQRAEG